MFTSKKPSQNSYSGRTAYRSYSPRKPQYTPPTVHRHKLPVIKIIVVIAIIAGVALAGAWFLRQPGRAKAASNRVSQNQLSQKVSAIIAANPQVMVGLSVLNLDSGHQINLGSTKAVTAASTTKLVTAIDYLHQVELGKYSLSDTLDDGTSGWQLQELINQSDDDSWTDFINLLGGNQIQSYAKQIGLSSFNFNSNSITPADEATMLQKLYHGRLLNPSHTKLLLSYMQHTNDDTLIPAALPPSATVYHKYGELLNSPGNYVNDAAIIINNNRSYILTIYTNRPDELDITVRDNIIHQITQATVDYENSL